MVLRIPLGFAWISLTGLLPSSAAVSTALQLPTLLPCRGPKPRSYFYKRFGLCLFRSPLLQVSLFYFLFLRVLRCFSSPGSLLYTIYSYIDILYLYRMSFLIRISADQGSFAAPRSFSQLIASFLGAWCQGILHMLFVAWSLLAYSLQPTAYSQQYLYCQPSAVRCPLSTTLIVKILKVIFILTKLSLCLYC